MKKLKSFSNYLKENCLKDVALEYMRIFKENDFHLTEHWITYNDNRIEESCTAEVQSILISIIEGREVYNLKLVNSGDESDELPGFMSSKIPPMPMILLYSFQQKAILKFLPEFSKNVEEILVVVGELQDFFSRINDKILQTVFKTQEDFKVEILKQKMDLGRSNEELEQFAYVASHDLEEPLRTITSYLELIENRYRDKLDEDGTRFIHFAIDGADRMKSLIKSLLEFSRLNKSSFFEKINVSLAVNDVVNSLKDLINENHAIIKVGKLIPIYGDAILNIQLFQNLITNAVKFKGEARPEIRISCKKDRDQTIFCVNDNGIGIKPENFERVFVIFQRLNSREKYSGNGMGLAICKKIVELHGGKIWVESAANEGSSFFFTIKDRITTPEFNFN